MFHFSTGAVLKSGYHNGTNHFHEKQPVYIYSFKNLLVGADILTLELLRVPSAGVAGVFICGSAAEQDPHLEC